MPVTLENPTPVYTAATNADAQLIASHLTAAGIDAVAIDDMSLGTLSEFHRPQVLVDKSLADNAAKFLREFESHSAAAPEKYCYHCGTLCDDASAECPSCNATLDWEPSESEHSVPMDKSATEVVIPISPVRRLKKPIAWLLLITALFWIAALSVGVVRMTLTPFLD